jgi:RNA polymerase sigma-70 factor (ECF subfamily)
MLAREFATTHWSVVLAAQAGAGAAADAALARLCETSWFPLYAFIRRRGYGPEEAQDLTQAFYQRLLEKRWLQQADPARGRFRTFLLTVLGHFLNNEWDAKQRVKRGGRCTLVSWDAGQAEARYANEPAHGLSADRLYDRRWALGLIACALDRLRQEHVAAGKTAMFEAIEFALTGDDAPAPYADLAGRLGMSEGALKVAVHRLRHRYGVLLREEVAHTVGPGEDLDEELRALVAALRDD